MAATAKIKLDKKELESLKAKISAAAGESAVDGFLRSCAKELAARLLAKVIKRTPVGQYPKESGKKGGTLRRGWTAKNQNEAMAGSSSAAQSWANSLAVQKVGSKYVIKVTNLVEYASYVEFGHRTRNGKGWVEGQFFLTISENEIRQSASDILQAKVEKYLRGMGK